MSEQSMFGGQLIDKVMSGTYEHQDVEEKVYADNEAISTTLAAVETGTVPDGHEGMIVSIAVSSDDTAIMYLLRDGKEYYENGLNCGGLSHVPEAAGTAGLVGVGPEIPLLIRLKEKGKWELEFKSTTGTPTISWRLRVRHFKKV